MGKIGGGASLWLLP